MNYKKKKRFNIKINKIYKEEMKGTASEGGEPINEKYDWIDSINYKKTQKNFIRYPFDKWKKIIEEENISKYNITKIYQKVVNTILKKDVFVGENFTEENEYNDIFGEFLKSEKIEINEKDNVFLFENKQKISPDFIVKNIDKNKFIQIIKQRDYMFNPSDMFYHIPENIKFINVIGEIKLNPNNNSDGKIRKQKLRYFEFCKYMNENNELYNNSFFFCVLVFDGDYPTLKRKTPNKNKPIIFSFIPQMHKNNYYIAYTKIYNELNTNEQLNNEDNDINTDEIQDKTKNNNNNSEKYKNFEDDKLTVYGPNNYQKENKIEYPQIKIKINTSVIKPNKIEIKNKEPIENGKIESTEKYEIEPIEKEATEKYKIESTEKYEIEPIEKGKIEFITKNKIEQTEKDNYENLSVEELIKNKRNTENKILDMQINLFNYKKHLMQYKWDIEDEERELEKINYHLNKKLKRNSKESFEYIFK